ncbi:MAG: universal stress protein [Acidobacteria bacterium]|nr:universal stress protein [Acidobacteriota bacterium]
MRRCWRRNASGTSPDTRDAIQFKDALKSMPRAKPTHFTKPPRGCSNPCLLKSSSGARSTRWSDRDNPREILMYAQDKEIDLICMGVHGAGFAMHALFGSNSDRVLRQSPCPVLIARPLKPNVVEK